MYKIKKNYAYLIKKIFFFFILNIKFALKFYINRNFKINYKIINNKYKNI